MTQETTVIKSIGNLIFGYKYYANIVNVRGTFTTELCSFIFKTKDEALRHKKDISTTYTFEYIETISFRSRNSFYENSRIK